MSYLPDGGSGGLDTYLVQLLIDTAISELPGLVRKLSTTIVDTGIDTKQDLFTVPVGKKCILTSVTLRDATVDLTNSNGFFVVKFNDNGFFNNVADYTVLGADPNCVVRHIFSGWNGFGAPGETAGGSFQNPSVPGQLTVDLFGYLIDA